MQFLELEVKNNIGYIWLNRPDSNDLTMEVMDELIEAHQIMSSDDQVWGVILASKLDKYFSNGLEPDYMLERSVEGRIEVFTKLFDMIKVIYAFPKVEISAISGHAMAGGAILAILTDFRFMAEGKGRYSFSEVRVGLTIAPILLEIVAAVVGKRNLIKTAMIPRAFKAYEALEINLVDALFPLDQLVPQAEKYLKSIFTLPQKSVRSVKIAMRAETLNKLDTHSSHDLEGLRPFLEGNFVEGLTAVKERRRPRFINP